MSERMLSGTLQLLGAEPLYRGVCRRFYRHGRIGKPNSRSLWTHSCAHERHKKPAGYSSRPVEFAAPPRDRRQARY
jgi:hypothetical protein